MSELYLEWFVEVGMHRIKKEGNEKIIFVNSEFFLFRNVQDVKTRTDLPIMKWGESLQWDAQERDMEQNLRQLKQFPPKI